MAKDLAETVPAAGAVGVLLRLRVARSIRATGHEAELRSYLDEVSSELERILSFPDGLTLPGAFAAEAP